MEKPNINAKYIIQLLEEFIRALDGCEVELGNIYIEEYGAFDDFIYSEYLSPYFQELLPYERKALMKICRLVLNEGTATYAKYLNDGYLGYETFTDFGDYSLEELAEKIKNQASRQPD